MFYYSAIGPLGWQVVCREEAQFNVNNELVTSASEKVVLPSLYAERIAAYIAFELNAGVRSE